MEIEVTHHPRGATGEFAIDREGQRLARLTYARQDDAVELLHTEVDGALRGTGAGGKLVAAAVDWARAQQLRLVPRCSFAQAVFAKTPEYADVWAQA